MAAQNIGTIDTLFRPYALEHLDAPTGRVLWLDADWPGAVDTMPEIEPRLIDAIQPEKALHDALAARGVNTMTNLPEDLSVYQTIWIIAGRHKDRNMQLLRAALEGAKAGTQFVVCGAKKHGIDALRKIIGKLTEDNDRLSKNHAVSIWFQRPADLPIGIASLLPNAEPKPFDGFVTKAGMFSSGGIDKGSSLLVRHLPDDLRGDVADFGAGWGFIAANIAGEAEALFSLDLYESNFNALECAKHNLDGNPHEAVTNFYWSDLAREKPAKHYDVIVMNPPFHDAFGKTTPELGMQFIAAARTALKPNGQLYLVANVGLPYEKPLDMAFEVVEQIIAFGGFKVMRAAKPRK